MREKPLREIRVVRSFSITNQFTMMKSNQMGVYCTNSKGQTGYTGLAHETQHWACVNGTPYVPASTYKAGTSGGMLSRILILVMLLINTVFGI
ncbi:hypothetical protein FOB58_002305 [Candida parapsilosis]|uniref:Uncharacterized protein n=2 Tax=Candida parapsilosis TaxID=5480 RepID=G8BBC8_CANPC|nr:uncharacterized protein CPAR2_809010 [Candida parapsilosis]KAF6052245.1 hypothetical protein FOB58_002305 [Candida parapsilosis]KAF6052258.1 hypothetical protein FOB60_002514 [Candida parapsilosis]KAF6054047.1 hypothetical protein FOB59_002329 [Candida parapsilosis]KAF6064034.1 hypothetical protein FOB61_002460 [Candida parapsilosis]CAD1811267.1 unnamed protein product [Candida parapsilosis]